MSALRFRTKLHLTFAILLAVVLLGTGITYWVAEQSRYHLERSRLAHRVLELHKRLTIETNRLFKQLADTIAVGESSDLGPETEARQRLEETLRLLRSYIASEVAFVRSPEDRQHEKDELDRLAFIQRETDRILDEFKEVVRLIDRGEKAEAWNKLSNVLDEKIDKQFNTLIEQAIADEREEVEAADRDAERLLRYLALVATVDGAAAVAFTIIALALLTRQLQRPLRELLEGTRALSAGKLGHRISLSTNGEFRDLATSFNHMAEQLERHQRQLHEVRENLERMIAERTKDLETANTALRQQDAGRRRFLSDISHELRTPLTVIRGEAEIALRGAEKELSEYRLTLQRIVEQAAHTTRLVDDLLFIARSDEAETRLKTHPLALDPLLERLCEDATAIAAEQNINIDVRIGARDVMVLGDPARLRQLFMIIIDNAVRYSKQNGSVSVDLTPSPKGVVVTISDEGVGIPPNEINRVFDRFYRGENAAVVYPEGSGLGLPMAKAIVEAHGGEIALASELDRGTTVSLTLPVVRKLRLIA